MSAMVCPICENGADVVALEEMACGCVPRVPLNLMWMDGRGAGWLVWASLGYFWMAHQATRFLLLMCRYLHHKKTGGVIAEIRINSVVDVDELYRELVEAVARANGVNDG